MLVFGRVLTAMIAPFGHDLKVDYNEAGALARRLIESGSDGVVVAETPGEASTLTAREKIDLCKAVVDSIGGRAIVVAGTGGYATSECVELTREAEKAGADGIILSAPYLNKPPQEGLFCYFSAIAKATQLPVMLCNMEESTSFGMSPDILGRLARVGNIVAIKDTGGRIDRVIEYREHIPKDFAIYSGNDADTLPMMAVGAAGVVSVASHLVGRRIKEMVEATITGRLDLAARINQELAPLFRALSCTASPIMVKAGLNILGLRAGGLRPPLIEADARETELLRVCMKQLGLF